MLITDTLRSRRVSTLVWALGAGLFHLFIAFGYQSQLARFPGGPEGLGKSLEVAASAMRVLRWPAVRLDTFGGYVTYHNLILLTFFLGLWAAVQGVHVTRGSAAERTLEVLLATGYRRVAVLRDRTLGFLLQLAVIGLGWCAGLCAATAVAGTLDVPGGVLSTLSTLGCALACYALGLLVAQGVPSSGVATGVTSLFLSALYLVGNVAELFEPLAFVRVLSPFFWANESPALLPGRPFSLEAVAVMLAAAGVAWALGAWAFSRRDVNGALLRLRPSARRSRMPRVAFHTYVWSELSRTRWRVLAWSLVGAFFAALMVWLEPAVTDALKDLEMMRRLLAVGGANLTEQYLSFSADIVVPVLGAFAAVHVGGWVAELHDGRVELMKAQPLSWTRLWLERLGVLSLGALVVSSATVGGLGLGALAVGLPLDGLGLLRTGAVGVLLAASVGGLGALAVAVLRSGVAVVLLSSLLGASYLLVYLVPMLDWPAWVSRLSLLGAAGHPYLGAPAWSGLALLTALALVGPAAAAALSANQVRSGSR